MRRKADVSRVGLKRRGVSPGVPPEPRLPTVPAQTSKRRARILASVVVVVVAGGFCWLGWRHVELRHRHAWLEDEVGRRDAVLASVGGAARAMRKRIEAQLLASRGWPPEPTAYDGGSTAEPVHAITRELSEIEQLVPRLAGMKRETETRQPAALGVPLQGAYWISSGMGWREDPRAGTLRFHPGLDMAAPEGAPVVAAAAGSVVWAGRYPKEKSPGWWNHGNLVVLHHGDTVTLYAHLDKVLVLRGTWVARGEALGSVGTTGVTTGPHLHYEVRQRGETGILMPVDPREAALR